MATKNRRKETAANPSDQLLPIFSCLVVPIFLNIRSILWKLVFEFPLNRKSEKKIILILLNRHRQ